MMAYASINKKGEPRLQATPPFNDGAALSETHDTEHIRNDSIRHTSVQSKTNTKTDSSRIENSHDDDRGITGFFKDGNQYKELHEDIIRNDSIRHTSVQSKTNTKTDSSRIENSRDEIYINNFLCLYVPV